jgi:hypothetical protein
MPWIPTRFRRRNWQTLHRLTRPQICARRQRNNTSSDLTMGTALPRRPALAGFFLPYPRPRYDFSLWLASE